MKEFKQIRHFQMINDCPQDGISNVMKHFPFFPTLTSLTVTTTYPQCDYDSPKDELAMFFFSSTLSLSSTIVSTRKCNCTRSTNYG